MENNNILNFYSFFISNCNLDSIYNMFDNIDNVLVLSDSNNIRMAEWLAIILNQKCINDDLLYKAVSELNTWYKLCNENNNHQGND